MNRFKYTPSALSTETSGTLKLYSFGGNITHPTYKGLYLFLFISLCIHCIVLLIHFTQPPASNNVKKNRSIEMVLVNAKHKQAPKKAEVLAQTNLDAGGNTDKHQQASTPLPKASPQPKQSVPAQHSHTEQKPQRTILTKQNKSPSNAKHIKPQPKPTPQQNQKPTPRLSSSKIMQNAMNIADLEARIDRNLDAYAKRPRKKFIGSRAKEYRFAQYLEDWRQKIEYVGNTNYPSDSRGNKLFGIMVVDVAIRSDGSVEKIKILQSSGNPELDKAALGIVKLASPFAAFPPNIRKDTDIIEITRTWVFTSSERLNTH